MKYTVGLLCLLVSFNVVALDLPHTFESHTPAKAQHVNENFSALKSGVEANVEDIGEQNASIASQQVLIEAQKSALDQLQGAINLIQSAGGVISGSLSVQLSGKVTVSSGSTAVTGAETLFTSELRVGDAVVIQGGGTSESAQIFTVETIASDIAMTLATPHANGVLNADIYADGDLLNIKTGDDKVRMVVDKGGRVGIGTQNPKHTLHVGDATRHPEADSLYGMLAGIDGNGHASIELKSDARAPFIDLSNDQTDFDMRIELTSDDEMTIHGGGVSIPNGALSIGYERPASNKCTNTTTCTATCPAGKYVLSGGCGRGYWSSPIRSSFPSANNSWTCTIDDNDNYLEVTAYAVCARLN